MKDAAALITGIAALVGALAWPAAIGLIAFFLRKEVRLVISKVPSAIDRMQSIKVGMVEAQLKELAEKSEVSELDKGEVTAEQAQVAANVQIQARGISQEILLGQMDRLAIEYDTIRRSMRGGMDRTREMTKILVQMRALSQSVSNMIDVYKSSGSAGSRLAAVTMMQMEPQKADLSWLEERFRVENPFIFYHAALALQNAVDMFSGMARDSVIETSTRALQIVRGFDGEPDSSTLDVLEAITA